MLRGPIIQYDSYLEKYDIEFNDTNFKNYITTFRSSDTRILSIVSENIIISSIKLYKELIQTTKLKDFIYVRLSSINDSIIHAFESNLTDRLIVIELDLDEVKFDHWIEKINKIFDPIQSSNKNKLIIISNQKNALKNILLADKKFDEINDDANTLQNFTIDSQKCILDTGTKFQRSHAKLSDLIDNDDLKNLINGETLLKILKDENIELYGKFIKNKYENYWTRKNQENLDIVASKNLAEDMYSKFVNQSKFLALDFLFDKHQLLMFLNQEDINNLEKYKIKINENGDGLGIVYQIIDNEPNFIHRTFAEYFTALFLHEVLRKQDEESLKTIEYFFVNMINQEHAVIFQFMDSMLNSDNLKQYNNYQNIIKRMNGKELFFVIKNNWKNIAIWLLENGINLDHREDNMNILHITCLQENSEMENKLLRLILHKLKTEQKLMLFVKEKNNWDEITPLNIAVENGRLNNVKCMLDMYVEEKIPDDAFMDTNRRDQNVFHLAAYNKCDYDTFIYLLKFASSNPAKLKTYFLKKDDRGHTPLDIAAAGRQLNKLNAVLDSNVDSEISNIIFDNVIRNGENIFHLAASMNFDDDTFIYLFKFASSDLIKLKTYFLKADESGDTPLIVATYHGQLNKLKAVLESIFDSEIVNSLFDNINQNGKNVFHHAAFSYCDDDTFIYLLEFAKNDPAKLKNYFLKTDNNGHTPLIVAAYWGQLNKLKAILDSNIDREIVDNVFHNVNQNGQNVYHQAATRNCHCDTFVYLLKFGNRDPVKLKYCFLKTDNTGDTPLIVAAVNGQINKLKTVLDSNVDSEIVNSIFNNVNQDGQNIFHRAVANSFDYDTFIYLLKFVSSDPVKLKTYFLKPDNSGDTPLNVAVSEGQPEKLMAVLDSNHDSEIINSVFDNVNQYDQNIFHRAAATGFDYDTFIYLLKFASNDPEKFKNYYLKNDNNGDTPLIVAAYWGQLDKLKAVLDSNLDSEILNSIFENVNRYGRNVFHQIASENCNYDTFIYLLKLVSNEPVKLKNYYLKTDNNGDTPLIIAAADGQLNKLKTVLNSNLDPEILNSIFENVNHSGQNVFHQAASRNCDYDTFVYLLKLVSNDPTKLKNFFLKTDDTGDTPLTVAAYYKQLNKLKAVLESNFDSDIADSVINNVNENGENVFHQIAFNCDCDTFIYLLKFASSDPVKLKSYFSKKNRWDDTPLMVVAVYGKLNELKAALDSNVNSEIVDIILQAGQVLEQSERGYRFGPRRFRKLYKPRM